MLAGNGLRIQHAYCRNKQFMICNKDLSHSNKLCDFLDGSRSSVGVRDLACTARSYHVRQSASQSESNAFNRSAQDRRDNIGETHVSKETKIMHLPTPTSLSPHPNDVSVIRSLLPLFTGRNLHSASLPPLFPQVPFSEVAASLLPSFPPSLADLGVFTTVSGFNGIGFKRH